MQKVFDDVAKFGWHVVAIVPSKGESGPEFAFTVGLYQTYQHPELVVFGLPMKVAHGIFTTCVERIEAGQAFADGQVRSDVLNGYDATFLAVQQSFYPDYLGSAIGFYEGTHFPVLQLVWPDRGNHFPWEPTADPACANDQIVLSTTDA